MFDLDPVTLARLQFGATTLYHFLFVPLTLGLSFLLAIMESAYVMTGREIWRDTTRFWVQYRACGKPDGLGFVVEPAHSVCHAGGDADLLADRGGLYWRRVSGAARRRYHPLGRE